MREKITDSAIGRWSAILPACGVPKALLTGRHMSCPFCGGRDRFRWTDHNGGGGYICNQCGAGDGFELLKRLHKISFADAARMVEAELPSSPVVKPVRRSNDMGALASSVWRSSSKLTGDDPASQYLAARGLVFPAGYPSQIRYKPSASCLHEDKSRTNHPALVSNFVAPDVASTTIQILFLDDDGGKAQVSTPRRMIPGRIPPGGAVRLAPSAPTMGIAEGVETALAAMQMFGIPVWASLSAGALVKWEPPETAQHVLVFGDNDRSLTGQAAAFALAHRLKAKGVQAEVRIPDHVGTDWNDVLQHG